MERKNWIVWASNGVSFREVSELHEQFTRWCELLPNRRGWVAAIWTSDQQTANFSLIYEVETFPTVQWSYLNWALVWVKFSHSAKNSSKVVCSYVAFLPEFFQSNTSLLSRTSPSQFWYVLLFVGGLQFFFLFFYCSCCIKEKSSITMESFQRL